MIEATFWSEGCEVDSQEINSVDLKELVGMRVADVETGDGIKLVFETDPRSDCPLMGHHEIEGIDIEISDNK